MAFATWNVMAGETPTEAKWNILGDNDDEFNALIQRNIAGTGVKLIDSSGNEILIGNRVASAVNEVTVTNAAASGVPTLEATGGDTNIHIQLKGKGNGLVKTSVLRQDNTTNSYKHNSVMLTGWGVVPYNTGAAAVSENVTYGITFAAIPIVVGSNAGDHGSLTTYGSGGNLVEGRLSFKTTAQTTTGFTIFIHTAGGTNFAAGSGFYTWIAVGEL